jgi:hypothetical protein
VVWIIFSKKWDLIAPSLFHGFPLSPLVAWGLLVHDGHRVTAQQLRLLPVLALLLVLAAPLLQLLLASPARDSAPHSANLSGRVATALLGGLAVFPLGSFIARVDRGQCRGAAFQPCAWEPVAGLMVIAIGPGWLGSLS